MSETVQQDKNQTQQTKEQEISASSSDSSIKTSENTQQPQQPQQQEESKILNGIVFGLTKVYDGAVWLGEGFASIFGLTESKYQFHLDEHNMKVEEKKRQLEKEGIEISEMEKGSNKE